MAADMLAELSQLAVIDNDIVTSLLQKSTQNAEKQVRTLEQDANKHIVYEDFDKAEKSIAKLESAAEAFNSRGLDGLDHLFKLGAC